MHPVKNCAAIGNIDFLDATTNAENRHMALNAFRNDIQDSLVAIRINHFIIGKCLAAIMMWLYIRPATGQNNTIQPIKKGAKIAFSDAGRNQD